MKSQIHEHQKNIFSRVSKTKLLFTFSLFSLIGFAQAPVTSYYGADQASYKIVNPGAALNQAPTGANASWTFSGLTAIGSSIDYNSAPTAGELSAFPGTTNVVTTVSTVLSETSEFRVYSKHPANVLSLTGIQNTDLLLNYSTNNAQLGLFPMEYGFSNTDNIAGNYNNGQYSGTFSGTINTSVDAWGTLNVSGAGLIPFNGAVTRLKTVQTISLNYLAFNNIGTVTVTTHSYYSAANGANVPEFRTTTTTVNVPLLSINQTVKQVERFETILLGTAQPKVASTDWTIAPNPVENILNIQSDSQKIKSITLTDVTGKLVLTDHSESNSIEVGHLQKGVYFVNIQTDSGSTVKKFIKK